MNPFELFNDLNFTRSLDAIRQELEKENSPEEVSKLLILAGIVLMEEGSENVTGERPIWITDELKKLNQIEDGSGLYYPVLLSFEASKSYESDETGPAESAFEQAMALATNDAAMACIYFTMGIYELNRFHNPERVLLQMETSISLFEKTDMKDLLLYFKYWAVSMHGFVLSLLERYDEMISQSLDHIQKIKQAGFLPLLENCYLNLARGYGGIGNIPEALQYLEKNLALWEHTNNDKRLAVGLTLAAVKAISFHEIDLAKKYLRRRKETWVPLDLHWNMIRNALEENGYADVSKNWIWM